MTPEAERARRIAARDRMRRHRQRLKNEREAEPVNADRQEPPREPEQHEPAKVPHAMPLPQGEEIREAPADGKILAIIGLPRPGNAEMGLPTHTEFLYLRGSAERPIRYEDWLAQDREPVFTPAKVLTPVGTYACDTQDVSDLIRVAELVSADTGVHINTVRETLSKIANGKTVRVEAA